MFMQNNDESEIRDGDAELELPANNNVVDQNLNSSVDPMLLLVRGKFDDKMQEKQYVKKLSNAVSQVITKHSKAILRCVGAASLNNAIKSVSTLNYWAAKNNTKKLVIKPDFTTVVFDQNKTVGIILQVEMEK
jgi:stage V sporulation protein SpoVS